MVPKIIGAKQEYHSNNIHLYQMDCMDLMPQLPDKWVDLSCVDPPYGIGCTNRLSKGKKGSIHKKFNWNDKGPSREYFDELYRISKHQIIWGCNYYADKIPHVGRIVHYKKLTPWSKGKKLSECDLASQSFNNKIEFFEYQWSGNVQNGKINWNNNGDDGRIHPQQKPLALYKWLLKNYAKPEYKIFDSHLGSASSAIAAYDFGIAEFVGTEIDKDYFDAAVKRFENHKLQQTIKF